MKKLDPYEVQLAIQFSERLSTVDLWITMAEELLGAARILEADVVQYWSEVRIEKGRVAGAPGRKCIQGAYFLLTAYAVENFFKALLIHKKRESFRNKLLTSIPKYINEHDLLRLAQTADMKLTLLEEDLLFRLSRSSIWTARYPVPTGPNAITAVREFSDGKTHLVAYYRPEDVDQIHTFVNRLREYVSWETGISDTSGLDPAGKLGIKTADCIRGYTSSVWATPRTLQVDQRREAYL